MTEKEIKLLGFEKHEIEDYDENNPYYYYLDIVSGLSFISESSDNVKDGNWFAEFFNTEPSVRFYNFAELQGLINLLTKHIHNVQD
jgi:hypothetical protein